MASIIDNVLGHLEKVRPTSNGRWIACCPAHEDKNPSMTIREVDDGKVLLHCFSGCSFFDIVAALGMKPNDFFPPRDNRDRVKPQRPTFSAEDVLKCLAHEARIIAIAANDIANEIPLSDQDLERVRLAESRILEGLKQI